MYVYIYIYIYVYIYIYIHTHLYTYSPRQAAQAGGGLNFVTYLNVRGSTARLRRLRNSESEKSGPRNSTMDPMETPGLKTPSLITPSLKTPSLITQDLRIAPPWT